PGLDRDLCCAADELCCGADTNANGCIPGGASACCSVADCALETGACYVTCDVGVCRQHYCADGAVCCADATGAPICTAGNCCNDANCGPGEACQQGTCTAVECFVDGDCAGADACTLAACSAGVCSYTAACPGECATC